MQNVIEPIVGQWYAHRDKGEAFRVVALDSASGSAEIQYFGGDVEELESDAWSDADIEMMEPPEDWRGPFDDPETEALRETGGSVRARDWRDALECTASEELWLGDD